MKAAIWLVALAACTGSIDDGTETGAGKQKFSTSVSPLLRDKCSACHEGGGAGPAFMGAAGAEDDYTAVRSNSRVVGSFQPTMALLLTKGSHSGVTWWTPDQTQAITEWLTMEAEDFAAGTGAVDLMAEWAGCMTIENWNDSKMAQWAQKQTDQGAACGGCHADGEYGFHANPTPTLMFDQQRTAAGIGSFFQVSAAGAQPEVAPSIDKLRSKCSGANLHPAAAVDDQYVEYLQRFYELTKAMKDAGLCKPPGYYDPTTMPPPGA